MQAVVLRFCVDPSRCWSVRVSEEQQRVLGPRDLLLAALRAFGLTWRDSEGAPVCPRSEPLCLERLRWSILLIFGSDQQTPTALILSVLDIFYSHRLRFLTFSRLNRTD